MKGKQRIEVSLNCRKRKRLSYGQKSYRLEMARFENGVYGELGTSDALTTNDIRREKVVYKLMQFAMRLKICWLEYILLFLKYLDKINK